MAASTSRDPEASNDGLLDRAAGALAGRLADRFSRRNALVSLASGIAAFFGVKFVSPAFGQTSGGLPLAALAARPAKPLPCSHTNACIQDGLRCGMVNAIDCNEIKRRSEGTGKGYVKRSCGKCWGSRKDPLTPDFPKNLCPSGALVGAYWEACCRCTENLTRGSWVEYYDCCIRRKADGTWDVHQDCVSNACLETMINNGVVGSGCHTNAGNLRDCDLLLDNPPGSGPSGAVPGYDEWCGYNSLNAEGNSLGDVAGLPLCTYSKDTGRPCGSS